VLENAGFFPSTERTALGITRVFVRGVAEKDLADVERRLDSLGFARRLVRREKAESAVSLAREITRP
jgi:hypothetical protein